MATRTNLWKYRETFSSTSDLVGYDVEATDGHIGKIDKTSNEVGRSYLVVDTGFWIFGKKRMIPAGVADRVDLDDRKVYIRMTKEEVKSAPDFDEQRTSWSDADYEPSERYYDPYGW